MKILTLNDFFYYSSPWEGDNSKNCGNQIKNKGWVSPISAHEDLIIYQMPKKTFGGKILNTNTGNVIYLNGKSILQIIKSCNIRTQRINN